MSELEQVNDRLDRIETKVDKLLDEVAELRGARKATYAIAGMIAAAVGYVVTMVMNRL